MDESSDEETSAETIEETVEVATREISNGIILTTVSVRTINPKKFNLMWLILINMIYLTGLLLAGGNATCSHPIIIKNLCSHCGKYVKEAGSSVAFNYIHKV